MNTLSSHQTKNVSFAANANNNVSKVNGANNTKSSKDPARVARDLETLLFATPDPNNPPHSTYQQQLSKEASSSSSSSTSTAQGKTIHVFPPSETLQQRASAEATKQQNKIRKIANGSVFRQQPDTSAALLSDSKVFQSEKSLLGAYPTTETYNPALSPNASLQLVVDSASDGDCVYIQPGTHELNEPLFISSKKKIFIIGFVESHTEAAPPTLRMRVTAEDQKKKRSLFAAYDKNKMNPIRPMIRVQQGAEVFLSHMRFEYVVEFPPENDEVVVRDGSKHDTEQKISAGRGWKAMHVDEADALEEEFAEGVITSLSNDNNKKTTTTSTKPPPFQMDSEGKELKRIQRLRDAASFLPVKANILEITGAATQVTLNHCSFVSEAHGIHFRCTATNVSASRTFISTPRLAIRDQCYFECPFGTALLATSEDDSSSGFASQTASRADPMSPPRETTRLPEGIVNISRSTFAMCQCACELGGPLHVKIADSDFQGCDIGLNVTVCMPMQLNVSETLFSKCQMGMVIDAPKGSGSSRDVEVSDCRFDLCDRGVVLQGEDCAASFDTCVATRCKRCGVLIDGGRATITNSIIQQNDVGVEVIDGRPVVTNTTFHGNSGAGVIVSGKGTTPTFRENTFTNTGEGGPSVVDGGTRLNNLSRIQAENDNLVNSDDDGRDKNQASNIIPFTSSRIDGGDDGDDDGDDNYDKMMVTNSRSGTSNPGHTSLRAHRRAVRCAAIFVEHDATPLVEFNRFEGNYGANVLIVSGLGVFTDNAFGAPATDSYGVVISGLKSCPRIEHNVIVGNERGQGRPAVVVEDGASAFITLNDFTHGSSSAVVLRRSGPQTVVSQNRVAKYSEGIVVMERSEGVASRNSMGRLTVEIFSDSVGTFTTV